MPNGDQFNPKWCQDKHREIDRKFDDVWGERGFAAVWRRMDNIERKLWLIILGLVGNLGGIVAMLIKGG